MKRAHEESEAPLSASEFLLFQLLRAVRLSFANAKGVPAYHVCSDKIMREVCRRCPRDEQSLRAISGIGAGFWANYGPAFLSSIASHCTSYSSPAPASAPLRMASASAATEDEALLFSRLRELRKALAAQGGVPAYCVCTDETLNIICRVRPSNLVYTFDLYPKPWPKGCLPPRVSWRKPVHHGRGGHG